MMEVGFLELMLIAVVALIVVGPERLPQVARGVGRWVGRGKRLLTNLKAELEMQGELQEHSVKQAELAHAEAEKTVSAREIETPEYLMRETTPPDFSAKTVEQPEFLAKTVEGPSCCAKTIEPPTFAAREVEEPTFLARSEGGAGDGDSSSPG